MHYTGACSTTLFDPCDQLTNEFAQTVFDNYRKVNEIAGNSVIIEKQPINLSVGPSDIIYQKTLTIEEWREELSLEK